LTIGFEPVVAVERHKKYFWFRDSLGRLTLLFAAVAAAAVIFFCCKFSVRAFAVLRQITRIFWQSAVFTIPP
jgi:hypothetical protein